MTAAKTSYLWVIVMQNYSFFLDVNYSKIQKQVLGEVNLVISGVLLPLLNIESLFGVHVYKEVLLRRGVIRSTKVRAAAQGGLDANDRAELDAILADVGLLFTV